MPWPGGYAPARMAWMAEYFECRAPHRITSSQDPGKFSHVPIQALLKFWLCRNPCVKVLPEVIGEKILFRRAWSRGAAAPHTPCHYDRGRDGLLLQDSDPFFPGPILARGSGGKSPPENGKAEDQHALSTYGGGILQSRNSHASSHCLLPPMKRGADHPFSFHRERGTTPKIRDFLVLTPLAAP